MIPRRVRFAVLLAFISHSCFTIARQYRLSYDAFTHMFFGDHYARNWWALWDARWFGGFEVISYPPLVHQLIGLLSHAFGIEGAYVLIQLLVLCTYPLAVYAFSRIFLGRSASSFAAIGGAFLPSLYYATYVFGQLPTLTATLFALLGLASLADFLCTGNRSSGATSIALMIVVMAAHHATLLFLPWSIAAILLHIALNKNVEKIVLLRRLLVFGTLAAMGGLLVTWPFWRWGAQQEIQTPIDHLSRHNFVQDPTAFLAFFLPMYGALIVLFPFLSRGLIRKYVSLTLLFILLCVLGLGGTTPFPKWLFGNGWEWLTYDRFALWGSLALVPFLGVFMIYIRRALPRWFSLTLTLNQARRTKSIFELGTTLEIRKTAGTLIFAIFALVAFLSGSISSIFHTQPDPLDMKPIVNFLGSEGRSNWRYLTFGFGDQAADLSRLADATTIDGSYFTARTLPELRESGIGLIDTAFWSDKGISSLRPILEKSGEHGVRWGFVYRKEYVPELQRNGWVFVQYLTNGVQVWENPMAVLPQPQDDADPEKTDYPASFSWGIFPIFALLTSITLGSLRLWPTQASAAIRGVHTFILGLLPLSLGFWYFRMVGNFEHPHVYFTYDHALFFLSDGLVVMAVMLWLAVQLYEKKLMIQRPPPLIIFMFAMCCLITISVLWSSDWRTSLYISLHFWLIFLLILSMRDWPACWNTIMLGLCALLSLEAVSGIVGFIQQSTASLEPFGMTWPGLLDASTAGAVRVRLPGDGVVLRAYGTLPHPNILGGLVLFGLVGCIALYLRDGQQNKVILLLTAIGSVLLLLTFSRSAWLATVLFFLILLYHIKHLPRRKLAVIITVFIVSFGLVMIPLQALFLNRTVKLNSSTDQFALATRMFLTGHALNMIHQHPITGVGMGSFVIQLSNNPGPDNYVEAVHNIPLLIMTELGIFGIYFLFLISVMTGRRILKTTEPKAILAGALLAALGLIGLFDHYLWTLAPGRIMLGLALGLWMGQTTHSEQAGLE